MSDRFIFICYSEKDKKWKDQLQAQLDVVLQQDKTTVFSDDNIGAGEDWFKKIEEALNNACVAVLLVSVGSLNPKFLRKEEVRTILELRKAQGLRIFPIIVTPCSWDKVEWLKRMEVRPKGEKALQEKSAAQKARELMSIAAEIAIIVDSVTVAGQPGPTVQPESPDRVSKADTSATAPNESSSAVQDLKAKRDKYLQKISELDKQIESSSSQTSSTGVDANPLASFGEGPGDSSKTTTKPSESGR